MLHVHSVATSLMAGELEFAGHREQTELPAKAYVPAPQSSHVSDDSAPKAFENLPPTQSTQVPGPDASLYLPLPHASQSAPFGPEYPVLHVHLLAASLVAGELEFEGQLVQVVAPWIPENLPTPQSTQSDESVTVLNLPVTHCRHGPPFGPV